ncbi:MAG: hypothetical protein ACXWGY_01230 [Chthoniobacterales bacterium]
MGNELNIDEQLQVDWLDAKLRDEMPYIDDAGFTARVVQQLPARRHASRSLRSGIIIGVTLIACVVAYILTGGGAIFADSAAFLVAMPFVTVCVIAGCCALLMTVLGAFAAFSREGNQRALREFARSIR